jgi:hypothetical protein
MATSARLQLQDNQKCMVVKHHSRAASDSSQPVVLRYTRRIVVFIRPTFDPGFARVMTGSATPLLIVQASGCRGRPGGILRGCPPGTLRGQVRFDASEEEATALE